MKRIRNGIILPVILLLVWYLITRMQVFSLYLLPSPGMVWDALTELAASGELVKHLSISLRRVFLGFLLAACTAIPLGILCGRSRYFYTYCWFLLEFLRHVPPLAAIPLIILWAGIDEASKLTIIFLASFFPLFLNTCSGIRNCDPKLLEVGQSLGFSKAQLIRHIQLPAALEELIAASAGIGYLILDAEEMSRPDIVLAGMLCIGIIGSILDWVFLYILQRLIPWYQKK